MSKITSEDCKDFLVEHFNKNNIETYAKEWKRTSKYKENGLWHRDFYHEEAGEITIIENNGVLLIKNLVISPEQFKHPKFTKEEIAGATDLMHIYIDEGFAYCYQKERYALKKEFMDSDNWKKYQHAIPGLFTFSIPDDTYFNDVESITDGLNSHMKIQEHKSLSILLLDSNGNVCDQSENEILKEGFLPSYTEFLDDYHITFNPCPENLTVGQAISYLESLGFVYRGEECLFKDYVEQSQNKQKTSSPESSTEEVQSYNLLTVNDKLNEVLENDNAAQLKSMIDNGLDINIILVNKNRLAIEAFKNTAYQCIEEIFNHKKLDIWQLSEGYNPENRITVASEILEILNYNAHKYADQKYTNMILEKLIAPENQDTIFFNKCSHILNTIIKSNKLHPYSSEIISKIESLLPLENFNSYILSNFKEVSTKIPELLEKTLSNASVGTLSSIVEQHALIRDYKIVLLLLDNKVINPQNVMVKNNDLRTFMALDINEYQKEIQSFIKVNRDMLSVVYQKKDKRYANELENMKGNLQVMYGIWQHINPSNKLKK